MKHKIVKMGSNAEGIVITGERENMEDATFIVSLPYGDVEITRATDTPEPDYWVHVHVNTPKNSGYIPGEEPIGEIKRARLDIHGKNAGEEDRGDFGNPDLYHLAVRVGAKK